MMNVIKKIKNAILKNKKKFRVDIHQSVLMHPGEFIREMYLSDELNETKLAKHLNVSPSTLNRILNGKSSVSCEMALRLEKVLGLPAETWLNMQNNYKLSKMRK